MAENYVSAAAFKASVSIPDSATDADVDMALTAASRAVEECAHRRTFFKDASPTAYTFYTKSAYRVDIGDFADVDSVTVDGRTVTDWEAFPLNAAADGRPYMWLQSFTGLFFGVRGKVAVTGLRGWPSVPPQVPQMVTIIASKLLKRTREAPFGIVTVGSIEGIAVRLAQTDPDMRLLLSSLTKTLVR